MFSKEEAVWAVITALLLNSFLSFPCISAKYNASVQLYIDKKKKKKRATSKLSSQRVVPQTEKITLVFMCGEKNAKGPSTKCKTKKRCCKMYSFVAHCQIWVVLQYFVWYKLFFLISGNICKKRKEKDESLKLR